MNYDPETIEGDYRESYQRWNHHFNKSSENIDLAFKDSAFVPFEPKFDPGIETPNWSNFAERIRKSIEIMNANQKNAKNEEN